MTPLDEPVSIIPTRQLKRLQADAAAREPIPDERASMRRAGEQIRYGPLQPWMFAYAEWLTLTCIAPPTRTVRRGKARSLARMVLNDGLIRTLEEREDFKKYCDELAKGPLEQARAQFVRHFPEYIEAHAEALDTARRAGDYTAVARIAEPILDRVMPKKAEAGAAAMVTVVLTPQQVAGVKTYEAPPILVQEEIVEPLPNDDSGAPSV